MTENKRTYWTAKKKLDVVMEGLKEKNTIAEICRKYGITQSMYYEWRNQVLEKGEEALMFGGKSKEEYEKDKEISHLQRKIGELTMQNDILKKNYERRLLQKTSLRICSNKDTE